MSQEEKGGEFREDEMKHISDASRRPQNGRWWLGLAADAGCLWEDNPTYRGG